MRRARHHCGFGIPRWRQFSTRSKATLIASYAPGGRVYTLTFRRLQVLSPVVRGRQRTPADVPGPRHNKIRCVFFQKRATDMQTAVGMPTKFAGTPTLNEAPRLRGKSTPRTLKCAAGRHAFYSGRLYLPCCQPHSILRVGIATRHEGNTLELRRDGARNFWLPGSRVC